MNNIRQYYRLCAILPNYKKNIPPISLLSEKQRDIILTTRQQNLYVVHDGSKPKETVIGGRQTDKAARGEGHCLVL